MHQVILTNSFFSWTLYSALFTIEVILKSIAYGFVLGHKNCYMRSYMNIVDFLVVAFSLFNIGVSMMGKPDRFQFKTVRIIRVVRMLKISSNLKRVINCLVNSLQRITYFLALYLLLLFIYSVIGEEFVLRFFSFIILRAE